MRLLTIRYIMTVLLCSRGVAALLLTFENPLQELIFIRAHQLLKKYIPHNVFSKFVILGATFGPLQNETSTFKPF